MQYLLCSDQDKHLILLMNSTLISLYSCAKAVHGGRTFPESFFQTISHRPHGYYKINSWKYMLNKESTQPLHNQAFFVHNKEPHPP